MPVVEKKQIAFRAHPQLYKDVIRRQAGTLHKAASEGVTNSVDAKPDEVPDEEYRVDVFLDHETLRIQDKGNGFPDEEQEIEAKFATFGTPHEVDEYDNSTDARFGRFRMGRGQLFCFGRGIWRSGIWQMNVDIEASDDFFELSRCAERHEGCTVDIRFYKVLTEYDLVHACREIRSSCEYLSVPVYLNGERISKDPRFEEWEEETDEYWFTSKGRGRVNGIRVYNQGVYVESLYSHLYGGMSGILVSKSQLKINTARNVISSECPRFKKIKARLKELGGVKLKKKKGRLTETERQSIIEDMLSGEVTPEACRSQKLFVDTQGKLWSFSMLSRAANPGSDFQLRPCGRLGLAMAREGNRKAEAVLNTRSGVVLDNDTVESWDCRTITDLIEGPLTKMGYRASQKFVECPIADMLESFEDKGFKLFAEDQLKPTEKMVLKAVVYADWELREAIYGDRFWTEDTDAQRVLRIGISDHASSWTDGKTYVAFHRDLIQPNHGHQFWVRICMNLITQMLFEFENCEEVALSPDMLSDYHRLSMEALPGMVARAEQAYTGMLARERKGLPNSVAADIEREVRRRVIGYKADLHAVKENPRVRDSEGVLNQFDPEDLGGLDG